MVFPACSNPGKGRLKTSPKLRKSADNLNVFGLVSFSILFYLKDINFHIQKYAKYVLTLSKNLLKLLLENIQKLQKLRETADFVEPRF